MTTTTLWPGAADGECFEESTHMTHEAQTNAAIATALGLMAILVEELVRTGAADAGRLERHFDEFAQSASKFADSTSSEVQYVQRLVNLVKAGLTAAHKEADHE